MFRLQTAQVQFVEKFRENRAIKADLPCPPIESDAEARLNQGEYRSACPGAVAGMRSRADGGGRLGLLQWRLC